MLVSKSWIKAPSVAFVIHPEVWGQGYVAEASTAAAEAWWEIRRPPCRRCSQRTTRLMGEFPGIDKRWSPSVYWGFDGG
ncbi:hypothetical protein BDV23DRAFT_160850 [Aspergillus alliaceus]|uniref:N-acetyltransferase domain-containing protein n=1 Tax=Petromyces alliaceus TaxID=209559 RepID=A0A5N7C120_PETAA|nr:hypothetical protein BDV23DRAFT_160850 [Aspergillus alliaceus]